MKLPNIKILNEKERVLHQKSVDAVFPLKDEDKKLITDMITLSQIDEEREKYDLRAGMGLSAVQVGVLKRIFVVVEELEKNKFRNYIVINPKVISHSEEEIFVGEGEGCLSVDRDVEGIVPRYARMTVEAYDENGKPYQIRVREDISIAFQHEIDHLNGILFVDKIDPKNPYKNQEKMREI